MKLLLSSVLGLGVLLIGLVSLQADDKSSQEPKTLKGKITCVLRDGRELRLREGRQV